MKRSALIGGLAALSITASVSGTAIVHAATPASIFAISAKDAGGPVKVTKTKHYSDGSTSYTFEGHISAHKNSMIVYIVNTDNSGKSAAQETSIAYKSNYNKPLFQGKVKLTEDQKHGIWIVRERGGSVCRDTMGTYWNKSAYAVTVLSTNTANCGWIDDATVHASVAIYNKLP